MTLWRQITTRPAGALPGNLVTKAGVVLIAVLLVGLILSVSFTGGGEDEPAGAALTADQQQTVDESVGQRLQAQVQEQARQEALAVAAADREAERIRIQEEAIAGLEAAGVIVPDGEEPVFDAATGALLDPDEFDLRRVLRLEEVERRTRSLRAGPVVLSFRGEATPGAFGAAGGDPTLAGLVEQALAGDMGGLGGAFMDPAALMQADADQMADFLAAFQGPGAAGGGIYTPQPGELDVALPTAATAGADPNATPARLITPDDPDGWERLYEGTFVEAVLVTQLSGDFPSPVLAQVAVPYYSADRQRILIPRGARFVGTAQQVRQQDQARLAVAFHRLLFPDGRYLPLHFQGLNQIGEGALRDEVDRHYFSTFLAAGSVGILSGLTLAGSSPYAGGLAGAQAGAGQGLGQAATQIMQRFLNRLPTITIRAGHRLRIWFTSDALIPTPAPVTTIGGLP